MKKNEIVSTKYYTFDDFVNKRNLLSEEAQIPHLYYTVYKKSCAKEKPTILELGTHRGMSTLMFLQAVQQRGGSVFSVDIDDQYRDLSNSSNWTFIHSDSTKVDKIVEDYPALKDGIDILLIDSLHTKEHVSKEFWGWEPYLNKDAFIIFDDIDPNIYRSGARKDHVFFEFDWEGIRDFVEEVFYKNEDALFLEKHYGSTGFAVMTKRTARNIRLKKNEPLKRRTNILAWKAYVKIFNIMKGFKIG